MGRWAVELLGALPWMPKPPRVRERVPMPRRKYITWSYVRQYGGTPGFKSCSVDGPMHSMAGRDRCQEIFKGDEDLKEAAEAAARDALLQEEARPQIQPETVSRGGNRLLPTAGML